MGRELRRFQSTIILLGGLLLAGCTAPSPAAKSAGKFGELAIDRQITAIEQRGSDLYFHVDLDETWDLKTAVSASGRVARAIGQQISAKPASVGSDIKTFTINSFIPTTGRLGEKGRAELIALTFSTAETRKVNFENLSHYHFLNLATPSIATKFGHEAVADYCSDDDLGAWSNEFCAKAVE